MKTTVKESVRKQVLEEDSPTIVDERYVLVDVPEQIIKEVAEHGRDCRRVYKQTSNQLRQVASETICAGPSWKHN